MESKANTVSYEIIFAVRLNHSVSLWWALTLYNTVVDSTTHAMRVAEVLGWGQDFDFFRANFDRANLDSGLHILEKVLVSF